MKKRLLSAAFMAAFFLPAKAEASQAALQRAITAGAHAHCDTLMAGGSWTEAMGATLRTPISRWYDIVDDEHRTMLGKLLYTRINEICPEEEAMARERHHRQERKTSRSSNKWRTR